MGVAERPAGLVPSREMLEVTEDFELANPDRVTLGTVGPVGERIFLLQVREGTSAKTLKMEKAQVSALARFLGRMLAELERPGELPLGQRAGARAFRRARLRRPLARCQLRRGAGPRSSSSPRRSTAPSRGADVEDAVRPRGRLGARGRGRRSARVCGSSINSRTGRRTGHSGDGARRGGPAPMPAVRVSARRERPRVPEDERPPPAPDLSGPAWLELLAHGELEILGRLPWSSNYSFLAAVRLGETEERCRLQARARGASSVGLPGGTVPPRGRGLRALGRASALDIVPETVLRLDGPHGEGSVQRFVDADFSEHYFTLLDEPRLPGPAPQHRRLRPACQQR